MWYCFSLTVTSRLNVRTATQMRGAVAHWQSLVAVKALRSWNFYAQSLKGMKQSISGIVQKWRWGWAHTFLIEWKELVAYKNHKKLQVFRSVHSQEISSAHEQSLEPSGNRAPYQISTSLDYF